MAEKFSVTAEAGINQTDGPHINQSHSPGGSVSASASGSGNAAMAQAAASSLGAVCRSENSSDLKSALAKASLGVKYSLDGRQGNGAIPLSFNFAFSGSVTAEAGPFPVGGVGSAHGSYSLETLDMKKKANARIAVGPKGPPLVATSGNFEKLGTLRLRVKPKISIEIGRFELFEQDFDEFGVDLPPFEVDTTEFDFAALTTSIVEAIDQFGLPRLDIAPGTGVEVSFDVTVTISVVDNLEVSVEQGGFLSAGLEAGSSAGQLATAEADFGGTLALESVTFAGNDGQELPAGLCVRFDSGLTMEVTRYASR